VFRELRHRQAQLDRAGRGGFAAVGMAELQRLFPGRPPSMVKLYLLKECGLQAAGRGPKGEELFGMREGARPPSDVELRRKVSPAPPRPAPPRPAPPLPPAQPGSRRAVAARGRAPPPCALQRRGSWPPPTPAAPPSPRYASTSLQTCPNHR
jgi:hypothetical protein